MARELEGVKKLLLLLPVIGLLLALSPAARADDHHRRYKRNRNDGLDRYYNQHGKRNRNDGLDRYYNSNRGFERRDYQGRSRYYRDGRYYYRGRDSYYPYGSRPDRGGVGISF